MNTTRRLTAKLHGLGLAAALLAGLAATPTVADDNAPIWKQYLPEGSVGAPTARAPAPIWQQQLEALQGERPERETRFAIQEPTPPIWSVHQPRISTL